MFLSPPNSSTRRSSIVRLRYAESSLVSDALLVGGNEIAQLLKTLSMLGEVCFPAGLVEQCVGAFRIQRGSKLLFACLERVSLQQIHTIIYKNKLEWHDLFSFQFDLVKTVTVMLAIQYLTGTVLK